MRCCSLALNYVGDSLKSEHYIIFPLQLPDTSRSLMSAMKLWKTQQWRWKTLQFFKKGRAGTGCQPTFCVFPVNSYNPEYTTKYCKPYFAGRIWAREGLHHLSKSTWLCACRRRALTQAPPSTFSTQTQRFGFIWTQSILFCLNFTIFIHI